MSVGITLLMRLAPGGRAAFEEAFAPLGVIVRAEDAGCERYELFRSVDDEDALVLVEAWTTQADLDAHRAAPHMPKVRALLATLAEPYQVTIYPL